MRSGIVPNHDYQQHTSSLTYIRYRNELRLICGTYNEYTREFTFDNPEFYGLEYNGYQGRIDEYTFGFRGSGGQCDN